MQIKRSYLIKMEKFSIPYGWSKGNNKEAMQLRLQDCQYHTDEAKQKKKSKQDDRIPNIIQMKQSEIKKLCSKYDKVQKI